jgi:hypothetical protein
MNAREAGVENCTHIGHFNENARNKGYEAAIRTFLASQYKDFIVESIL